MDSTVSGRTGRTTNMEFSLPCEFGKFYPWMRWYMSVASAVLTVVVIEITFITFTSKISMFLVELWRNL